MSTAEKSWAVAMARTPCTFGTYLTASAGKSQAPRNPSIPRPPARTVALSEADVAERLADLTGDGAEQRPGQRAYAQAAAMAFAPRREAGRPNMVLAEAGTGIGKRSEEHTSELQSLMRISYSVFCLEKKQITHTTRYTQD